MTNEDSPGSLDRTVADGWFVPSESVPQTDVAPSLTTQDPPTQDPSPSEPLVCEKLMTELVKLRKKKKIGQEPIAKAIGITQARVSQMENLKGTLSLEAVLIYAREIGANLVVMPDKKSGKKDV